MSSQASSAGRDEAKVRQKLVETGDVDVMIAIRSNFFYTRTVPCELWFLDRGQARGASGQGADDRCPQRLPQGHPQDL
jgi:type I restriction-modification system DNA methylase subunit